MCLLGLRCSTESPRGSGSATPRARKAHKICWLWTPFVGPGNIGMMMLKQWRRRCSIGGERTYNHFSIPQRNDETQDRCEGICQADRRRPPYTCLMGSLPLRFCWRHWGQPVARISEGHWGLVSECRPDLLATRPSTNDRDYKHYDVGARCCV